MPRTQSVGQVLAQEKTARQKANTTGANIKKNLAKEALFSGLIKTYHPYKDPGDDPSVYTEPQEQTLVQLRVEPELFDALKEVLAPALNLTAAKEWGNQHANADIEIDGKVLFEKVPAAFLLNLEHQVDELTAVLKAAPTLSAAEEWVPDTTKGISKTAHPEERLRDEMTEVPSVGHPGNEHHAAQVKWLPKRVPTGIRKTVKFSGAIKPERKEELLLRLHELKQALHRAREVANRADAPAQDIGTKLLDYLFA